MNITTETILEWYGDSYVAAMYDDMFEVYSNSANKIRNDAKRILAANLGGRTTGELETTIRARTDKDKNTAYVFAGQRERVSAHYKKHGVPVGIYWAIMVEFGTYWEPARPFMRPAADSNFNPLKAEAKHRAQRIINQERRDKKRIKKTISK